MNFECNEKNELNQVKFEQLITTSFIVVAKVVVIY